MKSTKISFISIFSISFKFASEKGIFSELEPKQVSGFSVNLQRGTLMMENPTQPENRTGHERLKLVGIKNLWMVREHSKHRKGKIADMYECCIASLATRKSTISIQF